MCDHGAYVEVCAKCLWSLCSPRDMYLMCMCDHGDLQVCIQCVCDHGGLQVCLCDHGGLQVCI